MLHAARQLPAWLIFDVRQNKDMGLLFFPLIALVVISWLYREDLGVRAIAVYGGLWLLGLAVVLALNLSPGVFVVVQCVIAIAMLIHVRANPDVPR
jgi:hypothetical protein